MRAIITEIRNGRAAALAEDGTVHLVDAKDRTVGQEIRIPAKHRRKWKKPLTWAACVAVLCSMATTGVYAAYDPYASVSVDGGDQTVEYTLNRFDQVIGTRVSGKDAPPERDGVPRFEHIDKAMEQTLGQRTQDGGNVRITVSSRSSGNAERLREHIDDHLQREGEKRGAPPKERIRVKIEPHHDAQQA